MAEFGAHLASKSVMTTSKPSVFEVLAQENLAKGLKQGFHYLSKILAQTNPERYSVLYSKFEEFYLAFDCVVQLVHLSVYKASFAEKVYGLQRFNSNQTPFTFTSVLRSLFWLVSFPYFKAKLDKTFEVLSRASIEGKLENRKFALRFLETYPLLCAFWESVLLIQTLRYTLGVSSVHNPLLSLSGVELTIATVPVQGSVTQREDNTFGHKIERNALLLAKRIAKGVGYGLSVGAFFLQFLDYWYAQKAVPMSFMSLPVPPPPKKYTGVSGTKACPICLQPPKNETVLATSGFVFCYGCIRAALVKQRRCPVTGCYSSIDNLIKLYPPES